MSPERRTWHFARSGNFSSPLVSLFAIFSCKMLRTLHVAHKSPVMQAIHTVEKLGKCICFSSIQQLATKNQVFFSACSNYRIQ